MRSGSLIQIRLYQCLEQLIPVNVTNQRSGIIIRGYVGGVLGEDIAYNLIHRIISLFRECIIYKHQRFLHLDLFSH